MDNNLLKRIMHEFAENQEKINFVWHGGEPLLAGKNFFREIIKISEELSKKGFFVYNSLQTNATLIDNDFADLIKDGNFSTGTSIDGTVEIHNTNRVYKNGKGTLRDIFSGINKLREKEILVDVICCVNKNNLPYPKKILNFFNKNNFKRIKFLQAQGKDQKGNILPFAVTGNEYAKFLSEIFEEWIKIDNPEIEIREIQSIINLLQEKDPEDCMFLGQCYHYLTIYPDGSVYPCDSLEHTKELYLGNIKDGLPKIINSDRFLYLKEKEQKIRRSCKKCEFYNLCKGGCLQDWQPEPLSYDSKKQTASNLFCEGLKQLFFKINSTLNHYSLI